MNHHLLSKLLEAYVNFLSKDELSDAIGLVSRMVRGDPEFVQEFVESVEELEVCTYCINTFSFIFNNSLHIVYVFLA